MSSDDSAPEDAKPTNRSGARRRLDLEVDAGLARGAYANMALISHTPNEFVLDFALAAPGRRPTLTARVITSPAHAKALLRSLAGFLAPRTGSVLFG